MHHHPRVEAVAVLAAFTAAVPACGDRSDAEFRAEVVTEVHDSIGAELSDLARAAQDLQAAAPTHAWDEVADAVAIAQMRDAWRRARIAYEHVESATVPMFAELDAALDRRYDEYLAQGDPAGDHDLFDATGVIGMHGIERILYAPEIRPEIIAAESVLPGYEPAAYPASDAQAGSFRTALVQKLVDDTAALRDQWQGAGLDIGASYQGLIGLMNEQKEKIELAAAGQEESRYADLTLFDLRNNLAGTKGIYEAFRPWIQSRSIGPAVDAMIVERFGTLTTLYGMMQGNALPMVPADWSSDHPTQADLATPFGVLWQAIRDGVDPERDGSIVFEMNRVAALLGFPQLAER